MAWLLSGTKLRDTFIGAALLCCTLALVCWPGEISAAVRDGLSLCGNVIIPSLFPFFVLSSLVISLGLAARFGTLLEPLMKPLFRLSGSCAAVLALGFIGGYPVGARAALTLYESGQCSKTEAERLLAFCNNSGPAFILGVVGAGVFADSRVGLLLCLTHAAASLCVGFLFRFYHGGHGGTAAEAAGTGPSLRIVRFSAAFTDAVKSALSASLNISAFVVCFTVIIRLCFLSGLLPAAADLLGRCLAPLGLTKQWAERLLTGILELSSGVVSLTGSGSLSGRLSMAAFLLGWAGVSVHCQVLSFLGSSGLNVRTYLTGKLLHGLISAALTAGLFRLFPFQLPVSDYLADQVAGIAATDLSTAFAVSASVSWLLFLLFFCLALFGLKKGGKSAGIPKKNML